MEDTCSQRLCEEGKDEQETVVVIQVLSKDYSNTMAAEELNAHAAATLCESTGAMVVHRPVQLTLAVAKQQTQRHTNSNAAPSGNSKSASERMVDPRLVLKHYRKTQPEIADWEQHERAFQGC